MTLAFKRGFEEEQKGVYTFKNTSEGTLARFIEWAYTGDYPAVISAIEPVETKTKETDNTETKVKEENNVTGAETGFTFENHPLLTHIHLYIFCSIYLVPDLQDLAFSKMTACFTDLEKPNDLDTQSAVISALRVSFHKLPTHDPLLDWMAQYAAYSIDKLRTQRSFHNLLKCSPILASRMVLSLNPASSPPWKIQPPKYIYPHYTDGYDDYDDDDY